tara:strand:+ start:2461 stop:2583 length:123 start_codon:yes stop_codon:yes gene_type:complete
MTKTQALRKYKNKYRTAEEIRTIRHKMNVKKFQKKREAEE